MKLYSFITSKEKPIEDFFIGSQTGLTPSLHKGLFLVAIFNEKTKFYDMHIISNKNTKKFKNAFKFGVYPIKTKEEIYNGCNNFQIKKI